MPTEASREAGGHPAHRSIHSIAMRSSLLSSTAMKISFGIGFGSNPVLLGGADAPRFM